MFDGDPRFAHGDAAASEPTDRNRGSVTPKDTPAQQRHVVPDNRNSGGLGAGAALLGLGLYQGVEDTPTLLPTTMAELIGDCAMMLERFPRCEATCCPPNT